MANLTRKEKERDDIIRQIDTSISDLERAFDCSDSSVGRRIQTNIIKMVSRRLVRLDSAIRMGYGRIR